MNSLETRQRAYAQLIHSLRSYRPRYVRTQDGLPESERLQLKIKLFVEYHLQKVLEKET